MDSRYDQILEKRRVVEDLGGKDKVAKQHEKGKLSAYERLSLLFDEGKFETIDALRTGPAIGLEGPYGDGVVSAVGLVAGQLVFAYSQDFSVHGGSLGQVHAEKICKIMDLAKDNDGILIGLNDSGGARIQEGVQSLGGYGEIFWRNVAYSGQVPQISMILGPCAGGAVYSPALTDFVFMVDKTSHLFITGPEVVKAVTQEEVTFDALGGSKIHTEESGVVDGSYPNELEAFSAVRTLVAFWNPEQKSSAADQSRLRELIPDSTDQPYSMHAIIETIFDKQSFFEIKKAFAPNIITGFARLDGRPCGIVANNPSFLAGVLDINASVKAARFIRFCNQFGFPVISFVDVPGFLPGTEQEKNGIIRHGAKLLYAYAEATVPQITVIVRKAYGGAYVVMGSKHLRTSFNFAWPQGSIAVMGAEGASKIIYRKEIAASKDPEKTLQEKIAAYKEAFDNPYQAADLGYVDAVILPEETREKISLSLKIAQSRQPKETHGNVPL